MCASVCIIDVFWLKGNPMQTQVDLIRSFNTQLHTYNLCSIPLVLLDHAQLLPV